MSIPLGGLNSRAFYWLAAANVTGIGMTGAALLFKPDNEVLRKDARRLQAQGEALQRATRLLLTVSRVALDYKVYDLQQYVFGGEDRKSQELAARLRAAQDAQEEAGMLVEKAKNGLEREEGIRMATEARSRILETAAELEKIDTKTSARSRLHARNADRLLYLARANGGVYIKVAQHCAQLAYLLPTEYIDAFSTCLDDAPRSKWSDARAVIEEELGAPIEELFESFEKEPIASASLAQVHVAYLKESNNTVRKVAVKVQHRGLRETSVGDIDACAIAVRLVSNLFSEFRIQWLVDEISPHLPEELNFIQEAKHCKRAYKDFNETRYWRSRVTVPQVIDNRSSERVLTMSFEEGVNSTDKKGIIALGIDPKKTATLVSQALSYQLFFKGNVNCDPHAANILIRPRKLNFFERLWPWTKKTNSPHLVLLDHGLYRELTDDFRIEYARLWRALALADTKAIAASATELGVGRLYPLFAAMLTRRPWDDLVANSLDSQPRSGDNALLRCYAQKYAHQITHVLDLVPRQMLLLLKMSDCLRNLEAVLGNTHYSHILTAHACADALYEYDRDRLAYSRVKLRLYAFDLLVFCRKFLRRKDDSSGQLDDESNLKAALNRPVVIPEHVSEWGTQSN